MEEDVRSRSEKPDVNEGTSPIRRWLIWLAILLVVFLLGLVPMWLSKRAVSAELDRTAIQLRRQQYLNSLSASAVYARRGEYETARQNLSKFYTDVQAELDDPDSRLLTGQERTQLPQILSGRDELITLVSRGDPASAERLSDLFIEYRAAMAGAQP